MQKEQGRGKFQSGFEKTSSSTKQSKAAPHEGLSSSKLSKAENKVSANVQYNVKSPTQQDVYTASLLAASVLDGLQILLSAKGFDQFWKADLAYNFT